MVKITCASLVCVRNRCLLMLLSFFYLSNFSVLFRPLVCAVLKVAVSASNFQILFPMSSLYFENHEIARVSVRASISELQSLLPEETRENRNEIPLRYCQTAIFSVKIMNILIAL